MSRSLQWNAVAYMIVAALLASLFFSFNLSMNSVSSNNHAADVNYPSWLKTKTWTVPAGGYAAEHPLSSKSGFQPVTVIPKSPTATAASAASSNPAIPATKIVPVVTEKVSAPPVAKIIPTYKVTSYYLNVRALPNAESKILKAVKMGTLLKVKARNENGWLTLEGGGYVHGGYAVPVTGELAGKQAVSSAAGAAASLAASTGAAALMGSDKAAAAPIQAKQAAQTKAGVTKLAVHNDTAAGSAVNEAGDPRKPTSKVMSDSGLTKGHIAALLKGTKLQGLGLEEVILGVEKQYGINAFFTIAVMKLESGNGKSTLSRTKNNLFGLNAVTGNARKKAFSFATKGDSIRKFGQLINDNYVEKGFTTIEKVARKYCPANGLWAGHVRTIMRGDFGKLT
ncbi:glucosaminidase domain-containing protein [Paenibacillus sacheonensis]|uniref:Mannosyl-glycoprotein endo-beta-N-acetylglucosamidase-like domain-containing protein n=1 Tax=Paenibacillus sacheonensis TaxID=742054 RepID=A0A7X5BXC5_9BACL|nr:glucosaminidase domain-containing protein [Paenibacillus sacheonensis]MBM7563202.1 hypothetical protein [Paenibacillus sacheonensis]NBC68236.1 hypothetical protein [Paenibacillus sacheonensis]